MKKKELQIKNSGPKGGLVRVKKEKKKNKKQKKKKKKKTTS